VEGLAHVGLSAIMVWLALMAVRFRDLLISVVTLAGLGLVLSLEFYLLRAPDVAIAEAAIGAGLTTAIYLIALRGSRREEE